MNQCRGRSPVNRTGVEEDAEDHTESYTPQVLRVKEAL